MESKRSRHASQLAMGLLMIVFGGVLLLAQFGVIDAKPGALWADWWPMVIVVFALASIWANPRSYGGALILLAVGVALQVGRLSPGDASFWDVIIPVLLIAVGLWLIHKTLARRKAPENSTVSAFAVWTGSNQRSVSPDFRGGSLTAIMGGISLDLRGADILPETQANLAVFAFWAGVSIRVPPHWRVEITGLPMMGGWTNRAKDVVGPDAPVLHVSASCIMGGMTVRH
ncbi:MAG: DUF5668 domain-containing protein [Bifidobacteriaceae bacterium]|jgi:hypothetical protein|nr:DUF5668 domain-containing protein [Bifidobacteriaceae bacterium]